MESFGKDVAAVVKQSGAQKAILIGHSMGGPVIVEAARLMPEKVIGLIGIDTLHDFEEASSPEEVEGIIRQFKADFKKAVGNVLKNKFVADTDPAVIKEVTDTMSSASPLVGASAMEELLKWSYAANPPHITVPFWCLNTDMWPTNVSTNRKYVPGFNLSVMNGVGHFLMLESPDAFNQKLDSIISDILKREGR